MKKVAYLGKVQLSDVDLSYLHEAQRYADITYIMEVSPRYMRGPAFDIQHLYPHDGVFKAVEAYPEFGKYASFINLDKFYVVNTTGRLWQLKSFWTHLLLLIFLIKGSFQTIHLAWPPNIYEFWLYFLRSRMILTVHDPFPHTAHDTFIVRLRRKMAFWLVPRLILLNVSQKKPFMETYHIQASRVVVSRLSCYTYLQTVSAPVVPSGDYILCAGRICQYKGIDYLLPAMVKIHERHPSCCLIIAGKGDFHFDISPYKSLDYIEFRHRFIPDEEMVGLIKNALFMACPYTDATQSGVIMSSYAFYRPVIATNVGGLPEMVQNGRHGLIIKEKDVDALAGAMDQLLTDREKLAIFSRNIEQDYTTGELSWDSIAKRLVTEYEKI